MSENKLYRVRQPRVRRVVYERIVWAADEADAIAKVGQGTAWPETYDEMTTSVEEGDWSAEQETDPVTVKVWSTSEGGPNDFAKDEAP